MSSLAVSQGPAPSKSWSVDASTVWGFGQGTHRNSGVEGVATLRVLGPSAGGRGHSHLGQERFFLERFRTRQKPEMLGSSRNVPPPGRQEVSSAPHNTGGASQGLKIHRPWERRAGPRLALSGVSWRWCVGQESRSPWAPPLCPVRSQGPLPENGSSPLGAPFLRERQALLRVSGKLKERLG